MNETEEKLMKEKQRYHTGQVGTQCDAVPVGYNQIEELQRDIQVYRSQIDNLNSELLSCYRKIDTLTYGQETKRY